MNIKQLIWSRNKVLSSKQKLINQFILCIGLIIGGIFLGLLFSGSISLDHLIGTGSVITAGVLGLASVNGDPENKYKTGKQVKARLWFIEAAQYDDTQQFPIRVNRQIGNIPLKNGEFWHYVDSVLDSPEPKWTGQMGDIAATVKNELTYILGGMADDVFDHLERGIGQGFYIVWQVCATGDYFIAGNACKPVRMTKFEGGSDKDKTATTVTFEVDCGEIFSKYVGNTPSQPAAIVAADAATFVLTSNPQYQLTSGTANVVPITGITGTTDADVNRVITLLGSGGTHPSTISSSATEFLLVGGATWTADAGSQISFKIFKDGVASYKFVEVAGSRS